MIRRPPLMMTGAALAIALALWAWLPSKEVADPIGGTAGAKPNPQSRASPVALDARVQATQAAPRAVPVPLSPPPSSAAALAVPITVTAPQKMYVGEMNDLVVSVGANAGISAISFAVQLDADVLQVRAGMDGDWAAGAGVDAHFTTEISSKEDAVRIRSAVSGPSVGMSGGSVAIVQIQAVAPGTTSVIITDVGIQDWTGRPIAAAISASNLQITVDSVPAPQPEASPQAAAVDAEAPDEATENGD